MPQATTPPPWERGQGHPGRPERPETHARFRAWLELGPSRSLAAYAAVLGLSRQSLYETAARFNWRERAAAWDAAEAAAGRGMPPPPPPRPRRSRENSSTPPEPHQPPPPDPGAMDAAAEAEQTSRPQTHREALSEYRRTHEALGRGMAAEAEHLLALLADLREMLAREIEHRRSLAEAGDHGAAVDVSGVAIQLVGMVSRLAPVAMAMANGGRMHWGDAIGVQRVLEEVWGKK